MVREIACPADVLVPVHMAQYDTEAETLACPLCGILSAAEVSERLAAELDAFFEEYPGLAEGPPLAEDEASAESIALKLFQAFPTEATFAAEAAEALAVQTFAGRLPREHVAQCIATAFSKFKAAA